LRTVQSVFVVIQRIRSGFLGQFGFGLNVAVVLVFIGISNDIEFRGARRAFPRGQTAQGGDADRAQNYSARRGNAK